MLTLYHKTLGDKSKPCLVFLHGLFGNHRNLLSIAKQFENDFYCILADMRNHGRSDHNDRMDYELMSEDLACLLETLGIKHATLIGHSMGGKVSMMHALKHPSKTHSIIILDIAPVRYDFDYLPVIENLLSIDTSKLLNREQADQQLARHYQNHSFRQFLLQNLVKIDDRFEWRLNLHAIKNNIEALCQFKVDATDNFDKPSYFLAGAESDYVKTESHPVIANLYPRHTVDYVENAGHWIHAEQPGLVIQKIHTFLSTHYKNDTSTSR